jgi:hypothetical protein
MIDAPMWRSRIDVPMILIASPMCYRDLGCRDRKQAVECPYNEAVKSLCLNLG